MIDLPHVASRVFGTPLMIARAKLEVILGVLAPRFAGGPLEPVDPATDPAPLTSITVERIAVVSVIGTLVSRSGYLDAASGLLSYGDIGDAIAAAMDDPSVRGVILDVDSPGGEVGGLFDLVEQIGAIKAASDKPLWAVANESALSAAYAIASTADRLYVTRTGEVGSIGVVAVHVDESGADAKAGLAWTFVFAGEQQGRRQCPRAAVRSAPAPRSRPTSITLYAQLCGLGGRQPRADAPRPCAERTRRVYRGELAVRAGLADRVGTLDLAIAEMAAELDRAASPARNIINPTPKRSTSMAKSKTEQVADDDAAEPQPSLVAQAAPQAPAPILNRPLHPSRRRHRSRRPNPVTEPGTGRQAAGGICRDRRPRRSGRPARRHGRCRGRHAQGHLG